MVVFITCQSVFRLLRKNVRVETVNKMVALCWVRAIKRKSLGNNPLFLYLSSKNSIMEPSIKLSGTMDKLRYYYEKIKPYLTRRHMEMAALVFVLLCALFVYLSGRQHQAVLSLKNGEINYSGQVVRNKPSGTGKITFSNGDVYEGEFEAGSFDGKGNFKAVSGWSYEGQFEAGLAHGQGTLTTETGVVYKGTFNQGVYQDEN